MNLSSYVIVVKTKLVVIFKTSRVHGPSYFHIPIIIIAALRKLTLVHPGKLAPGDTGEQREPLPPDEDSCRDGSITGQVRWEVGAGAGAPSSAEAATCESVLERHVLLVLCHPGLGWMSPVDPGVLCHSHLQGRGGAAGDNTPHPPIRASHSEPARLPLIKVTSETLPSNCFPGSINFHIHNTTAIYRAAEQKASGAFHFLA